MTLALRNRAAPAAGKASSGSLTNHFPGFWDFELSLSKARFTTPDPLDPSLETTSLAQSP